MFGLTGTDIPYRGRKDLARAQQLHGLTRRRTGPSSPLIDDLWMPMLAQDLWRRDFAGRGPSRFNRFEELEDVSLPRSMPSNDIRYGSPFAKDSKRRAEHTCEIVHFEQAADALCQALHFAIKHCKGIQEHFEGEVERSSISLWAAPKVVDALWAMNVDWNGVDLAALEKNPNQQPSSEVVTYKGVAKRLMCALDDMKSSGRPRLEYLDEAGSKLSPEVFRTTLNKLQVTMQGIEELMQSVAKDRSLMEPLIKDMMGATSLLADIEDLWRPPKQPVGGKARSKWGEDDDYVWPDYHGE